ncbi:hypothetical protein ALC62_06649 [Cyphomyrmex costatus]|uniref:Uncharacterized protein n=1 Tax=Cyphomyrmex costatus TaxID=456900 RepID=A0A151IIQ2_9HYME|nr:hypothetical protein ALC62_06649 [Cyphomyrmex costatus]
MCEQSCRRRKFAEKGCVDILIIRVREVHGYRVVKNVIIDKERIGNWSDRKKQKAYNQVVAQWTNLGNQSEYGYYCTQSTTGIKFMQFWSLDIITIKLRHSCRCIEMNTYSGTRAEVVVVIDKNASGYKRERDPAIKKLLHDKCDDTCSECEKCRSVYLYNDKVLDLYDIVNVKRWCSACKRITCKCAE